ncbi:hypothetical protein C8Q74DRAFT_604382 [Fomes fomentarius]|nr:hypothetical protein C8Q74DRAFT_604382 [Fomes fomentarius]
MHLARSVGDLLLYAALVGLDNMEGDSDKTLLFDFTSGVLYAKLSRPKNVDSEKFFRLSDFASAIQHASFEVRSSPVTSIEIHQRPLCGALKLTPWGHQYIVATVKLPSSLTYIRFELDPDATSDQCCLHGRLLDNDGLKAHESRLISSLSLKWGQSATEGPSLESLAALCQAIENHLKATGDKYDALGRNCNWFADLMLFCMAKRFSKHWLAGGRSFPSHLMDEYMLGRRTAYLTALGCVIKETTTLGPLGFLIGSIGNVLTHSAQLDSDVDSVLREWKGYARARTD